jgi:hypothetical protein
MRITIDVTSNEAEIILFALALRSKQSKLSQNGIDDAVSLSERLNRTFEQAFGWTQFDRTAHNRKPIKRVSITCYDYPPAA